LVAGTLSFSALDPGHGILTYSIDAAHSGTGMVVGRTLAIQRQSLMPLDVSGTYMGAEQFSLSGSGCGAQDTPQTFFDQIVVTQVPSTANPFRGKISIGVYDTDGNAVCKITGTGVQTGKTIQIDDGVTTCPSGSTSTPVRVYDMRVAADAGIEYRWTTTINRCTIEGRLNALNSLKPR
jgi:hypothetical protein